VNNVNSVPEGFLWEKVNDEKSFETQINYKEK